MKAIPAGDFAPRPWSPTAEYYIADGHDIRDVIEAFGLNYNRGAIVKYIARAGRKPGNDARLDLLKAREHVNRELARLWHQDRAADPVPAYWYLATPYRGHPAGFAQAMDDAARWAAWLIDVGVEVYSPIVHSHPAAQYVKTAPPEGDFWLDRQVPFMAAAAGMLVAPLPGWERSSGIAWERQWFGNAGKPILDLLPTMLGGDGTELRTALGKSGR